MAIVNIYDAKTHFSKLVDRVQRGEEIVIAKNGTPVASIQAYKEPKKLPKRKFGIWADRPIGYKDENIVGPDPDIIAEFEASINRPLPGYEDDEDTA